MSWALSDRPKVGKNSPKAVFSLKRAGAMLLPRQHIVFERSEKSDVLSGRELCSPRRNIDLYQTKTSLGENREKNSDKNMK